MQINDKETNIEVINIGKNPTNDATKYALKIDADTIGTNLTKIDVMMKVWSALGLPPEQWETVRAELQKLDP